AGVELLLAACLVAAAARGVALAGVATLPALATFVTLVALVALATFVTLETFVALAAVLTLATGTFFAAALPADAFFAVATGVLPAATDRTGFTDPVALGTALVVALVAFATLAGLTAFAGRVALAGAVLVVDLMVFPVALAAAEGFLAGLAAFFTGFLAATYEGSSEFSPAYRESGPL